MVQSICSIARTLKDFPKTNKSHLSNIIKVTLLIKSAITLKGKCAAGPFHTENSMYLMSVKYINYCLSHLLTKLIMRGSAGSGWFRTPVKQLMHTTYLNKQTNIYHFLKFPK